jgi:hypothetical protein
MSSVKDDNPPFGAITYGGEPAYRHPDGDIEVCEQGDLTLVKAADVDPALIGESDEDVTVIRTARKDRAAIEAWLKDALTRINGDIIVNGEPYKAA